MAGTVSRATSKRRHTQLGLTRASAETASQSSSTDLDAETDKMLLREKRTLSRGRIQQMRIMSAVIGNAQPSRKKLFTAIQTECDYKLYSITVHNKTIPCAKVYNPAILGKNSEIWSKLAQVQKFELEDPEGTLTTIPKHYAANMEQLESFSITWTRVKSVPGELFREGLRTLHLQRNHLKTLNGIERAADLSILDVSSNLLTEVPKTMGQLKNLTSLNISGNAIKELPENFGALSQLRILDCSCNRLTVLPKSIGNLIQLSCLDVSNNNLKCLPESISELPKLEDFRARANQLEHLPHRFGQLNLHSLILRKNKFTEVPHQLSTISMLQNLNMRENMIRLFLYTIPSLNTLILDSNELEVFSDELLKCSNLQMLSLEDNRITSIPATITRLKSLRVLSLSGNDIESIPEEIDNLEHLRHLNLNRTLIENLPDAILTMTNLVKLDITDCPQLQIYLSLAHKEGGITQVRSEMLQARNQNTISCDGNTVQSEQNPTENISGSSTGKMTDSKGIQTCKHKTIMLDDLPSLPDENSDSNQSDPQPNDAYSMDTKQESPEWTPENPEITEVCSSDKMQESLNKESSLSSENANIYRSVSKKKKVPTATLR